MRQRQPVPGEFHEPNRMPTRLRVLHPRFSRAMQRHPILPSRHGQRHAVPRRLPVPGAGCDNTMQSDPDMPAWLDGSVPVSLRLFLPQHICPDPVPRALNVRFRHNRPHAVSGRPDMRGGFISTRGMPSRPVLHWNRHHRMPSRLILRTRLLPTHAMQRLRRAVPTRL